MIAPPTGWPDPVAQTSKPVTIALCRNPDPKLSAQTPSSDPLYFSSEVSGAVWKIRSNQEDCPVSVRSATPACLAMQELLVTGILGALSLCLPPAQADLAEDAGGFLLTCKGPPAEKCRWPDVGQEIGNS